MMGATRGWGAADFFITFSGRWFFFVFLKILRNFYLLHSRCFMFWNEKSPLNSDGVLLPIHALKKQAIWKSGAIVPIITYFKKLYP